ncbi:hypothetical protein QWY74_12770 [Halomonas almeriensis]|uniref:hypothetical protein n=1 Tax=Halomonas almeriensis TaxID=308163 RepID=UPI0025B4440D|nr:hypothetical protein [Halomonas almeriensis]MDN3554320.1 hypothetical protein [Halomonas almeriensis]
MADFSLKPVEAPDSNAKKLQEGQEFFVQDNVGRVLNCRVTKRLPDGKFVAEIVGLGGEGAKSVKELIGETITVGWEEVRFDAPPGVTTVQ